MFENPRICYEYVSRQFTAIRIDENRDRSILKFRLFALFVISFPVVLFYFRYYVTSRRYLQEQTRIITVNTGFMFARNNLYIHV